MDLIGRVPRLPAAGETVLGTAFVQRHGGKGGNQAVAAARLGAVVAFSGAVGADAFGDELLHGLRQEGIDTGDVRRVEAATGCALIAVADGGENSISVLPGANRQAPWPGHDGPAAWQWLVLQLETPVEHVAAWAAAARARQVKVLLNAAPMAALPAELLGHVDVLVVNEGELHALAGGGLDTPVALQSVSSRGPRQAVVTLGPRGALAWDAGRLLRVPARAVTAVDTTGAGDTFVGALAAALDEGRDLEAALAQASAAAALACTRLGAREGSPTRGELAAWLARQGD